MGVARVSTRGNTAERLTLVGASAGSGKTYRLTEEVTAAIDPTKDGIPLEGLVAVTYTRKAAAELGARIRRTLVTQGAYERAQRLPLAYLGTVHAVSLRLLQEFAMDAGLSPHVDVLPGSQARLLRQSLEWGLDPALRRRIETLAGVLKIRWDAKSGRADWLTPLDDVMTLARSNRVDPQALQAMAERSADGLLTLLGTPRGDGEALDHDLLVALGGAAAALTKIDDGQQNTSSVRQAIDEAQREAEKAPLPWSDWIRLSKLAPGKTAKAAVEPLTTAALRVYEHPRLHAELREYTLAIFAAARDGLVAYDTWKKRRRVVDFVDMIDRALTLLEQKDVADELRERIRLLVVDEFQDTSPVQLALFVRLHALAKRSTWVGDRKQCIFEFAGADPALMEALTRWVGEEGGITEQLPSNWRSRPELVEACSHLFSAAFSRHGYGPSEVEVTAMRETPKDLAALPPLGFWALDVKNQEDEAEALAEGVRRLLDAPTETRVVDRATTSVRDLRPGDLALLVATNAEAERVAEALAARGVRVTVARAGLLATPEGTLVEAALRALIDPRDELARATIDGLTGFNGVEPETWLDQRIAEAEARRAARTKGETSPVSWSSLVARVGALAPELETAAPSEALDRVLAVLDVVTIACRWPDPTQRLANLDALRAMAAAYEERSAQEGEAATIAGLLRYFDEAAQKVLVRDEERASDEQHVGAGDGAVAVLTYHRAKGLEWPVVVLGSLNKGERRDAFEVAPETDRPAFDPDQPLAGRWIRYWPWPFGQQKKTRLAEVAAESTVGRDVATREEKERVRLLYVGFTRARDHLVLAARVGKKGAAVEWLDELCDAAGKALLELPAVDGSAQRGVVGVRGARDGKPMRLEVSARLWTFGTGGEAPVRVAAKELATWFVRPEPEGTRAQLLYRISPSRAAEEWTDVIVPSVGEARSIGQRLPLGDGKGVEWNVVGDTVHAFLASDAPKQTREQRLARAERLLAASALLALLAPDALLRAGDQLRAWAEAKWPGATWHCEYPVNASIATECGARRVSGAIDLLLMTNEGAVVVDHKSFPGASTHWVDRAREFAPQMGAYAHVLRAAGIKVVGQYVHFTVGAGVVSLA
jgi:ATP-dependent exoDNAse (exonuclease V) beta subunit